MFKNIFGDSNDDNLADGGGLSEATTFSWDTRLKGFVACAVLSLILSIFGTIFVLISFPTFVVFYSLGTVCSLLSTLFLMGPARQINGMFDEKRRIASIVLLSMIILTLCAGLWWDTRTLAMLFCVLQYLAYTWYCLSYIPYGRTAVIAFLKGVFNC